MTDQSGPRADDAQEPAAPALGKALADAAGQAGFGALGAGGPSGAALLTAMGGVRGIVEAVLPGIVFLVPFTIFTSLDTPWAKQWGTPISLGASVLVALVFTLSRVATKSKPTQAIAGLLGVAASAILALLTGNAANNFLLGFAIDAVYAVAMLVSMLLRWPLLGVVLGYLLGDGVAWRTRPAQLRAFQILTLCWFALFALRLVVQLPLYFADLTIALGVTKLLMGLPLYASLVLLTWLMARALYPHAASGTESGAKVS
jgi:hypothetical protein